MILYSGPLSLFARKTEIALGEKGIGHGRVMVPFSQTAGYAPKNPDVLRVNPKGQVPVLIDGDFEIYDSTVIMEYLEDAYPNPPLYPGTPTHRARIRLMELEADEVLLVPVRTLMFRTEPPGLETEKRVRQEALAALATAEIAIGFDRLNGVLDGKAFLAEVFSAADIATFMIVHYAQRLGGPSLSGHVHLKRWYKSMLERPSFAKAACEIAEADKALSHPVEGAFSGAS
jgi:glutathione S-transferase